MSPTLYVERTISLDANEDGVIRGADFTAIVGFHRACVAPNGEVLGNVRK